VFLEFNNPGSKKKISGMLRNKFPLLKKRRGKFISKLR